MTAKRAPAKKAAATKEVKPSNVRTIQVSETSSEKVQEEGYVLVNLYSGFWDSAIGPFKSEDEALKFAKKEDWEAPYYIAKFQIVARCI